jgi:phospholipid/cholesterol/gamma-HCH transport system substrate-binding protein
MSRNVIETVMGAVVLVIAALFLVFAYSTAQVHAISGYQFTAKFSKVDGIREGGDVRISGIKVGSITSETLDPQTYEAIIKVNIDPSVKLPVDTQASILSSGLLGDKFVALVPGGSDDMIKPGGQIMITNAPISLEDIIGQLIFSQGGQQKKDGGQGAAPPAGAAPTLAPPPGTAPQGG